MLRLIQEIFIGTLIVRKNDVQSTPPPLDKRNESGLAESNVEKAGEFNGQFTDMFTKPAHSQVRLLNRKAPFMEDIMVSKESLTKLLKGALGPDELHPIPKGIGI